MKLKYKETVGDISIEYEFDGEKQEIVSTFQELIEKKVNTSKIEVSNVDDSVKKALLDALAKQKRTGGMLR